MLVLVRDGADAGVVWKHGGFAALGPCALAIPDAALVAAAGREPATGAIEVEEFDLGFVATHVELLFVFGAPEVHARVLVAGDEPAVVGRPNEGVDAVGVGEFGLGDVVIGVPEHDAAKVGGGEAAASGLPGEGADRFGGGRKTVSDGCVGIEQGEGSAGRGGEGRAVGRPGQVFDPRCAEGGAGGLLSGARIPKFGGVILSTAGEERLGGMPSEHISAVIVTGELVLNRAVFEGVKGDGAVGGCGRELGAIGRPREVDRVVIKFGGPVFGQLHTNETVVSWAAGQEPRCGRGASRGGERRLKHGATVLAAAGFAFGGEGGAAAALDDVGLGFGNFAGGLAPIDFDFTESAGGFDCSVTEGGAHADNEIVHAVAHVVGGGGHVANDAIEKVRDRVEGQFIIRLDTDDGAEGGPAGADGRFLGRVDPFKRERESGFVF